MNEERYYKRDYENLKKKSTTGKPNRRRYTSDSFEERKQYRIEDRERRRQFQKMAEEEKLKRVRKLISVSLVGALVAASPTMITKITDIRTMDTLEYDFKKENIIPETHRTNDGQNYFYDYIDIANNISDYTDYEEAIYLLDANIGETQTNRVLEHTQFKTLDNFIEEYEYDSIDSFKKEERQRILDKTKDKDKKMELESMMNEEQTYQEETKGFGER